MRVVSSAKAEGELIGYCLFLSWHGLFGESLRYASWCLSVLDCLVSDKRQSLSRTLIWPSLTDSAISSATDLDHASIANAAE